MVSEERFSVEDYDALYTPIVIIGVADKMKLAISGNQADRSILVRDPNKMVAVAVFKSPSIEQDEIKSIAKSRSVCAEVLRAIASSQEWMKISQIRFNVASNPKTPAPVALKILPSLDRIELAKLAADKEIDPQVSLQAGKFLS